MVEVQTTETVGPRRAARAYELTAAYTPCEGGGYLAEILGAETVCTQGETLEEARVNLRDVVRLLLEEAPRQVVAGADHPVPVPAAAERTETLFVVMPIS